MDYLVILISILDQESRIITRICVLHLPSRLVHQLVTSPLPDLHINGPIAAIKPLANKMCMIFRLVLVVVSVLSMVSSCWQEA